ncbi:NADPH:quinone oxidoreductase family protein [Jeotgalibacillus soli]|uniref:Quinone oxidoreductase n=1 Tax=Jeotgalibacillus soli TaxID=889306 RepID=A0A0C2RH88_9BACL|nr:acryloyl-CoA reductase [Jeotgalibacillus soli]KIL49505.1 quinone oxidoreductase [Jeotgalibacillus soli]
MDSSFKAVVVDKREDDFSVAVKSLTKHQLPEGDVLIKVSYSSVNYKDGLAGLPNGKIVQSYPFVPGIDLSGLVVSSTDDRFKEGDKVIATSYGIGVSHFGGYCEYASIPADWIVPLPENLSLKEAMIIGTAGFTAALSIHRLEENGITPDGGDVLVTGATGGVGSVAVSMLHKRGYHVTASTGKESEHEYLKKLGANSVISREAVFDGTLKPMTKTQWQAAVDPVGGKSLASVLSKIKYRGAVAVSGLTGGGDVPTSVFPFILRGVSLLGIDSVECPMELRKTIWARLADDLKLDNLEEMVDREIPLEEVPAAMADIIGSKIRGRVLVAINP